MRKIRKNNSNGEWFKHIEGPARRSRRDLKYDVGSLPQLF
jgi:hypothetical protein